MFSSAGGTPDGRRVDVVRIQDCIKRKAKDTQETQIITSVVSSISESAAASLPTVHTMRRAIRRHRQQEGIPHPIPQNIQDMKIPEELKVMACGKAFLLYDSGPGGARTLIFSTTRNLELLQAAEAWFADGTFKVVPEIFFQLYTLHVLREGRVIPCVYALLPNKQEITYQAFLSEVLRLKPGLNPRSVLVDFEQAAINAFHAVFPNSTLKGCFYHLSQNIYRKVQAEGLQERYASDEGISQTTRMLAALVFVPTNRVVDTFEILQQQVPPELEPIADYVEDNYIGRPQRGGRRPPWFPIDFWNIHDRIADGLPRTNNSVEGFHCHIQASILCCHPNIWPFIWLLSVIRSSRDTGYQMWPEFLRNHRAQNSGHMKNILALLKLAMVIPVSTAEAESKVTSGHVWPQKLSVIL